MEKTLTFPIGSTYSYSNVGSNPMVQKRDTDSLKTWASNNPNAILDSEFGYVNSGDDLVYVTPKADTSLRQIYDQLETWGIGWFPRQPTDTVGYDAETTALQDDERTERVMSGVILLVGLCILVGPMWILEFVHSSVRSLAVIKGFIICILGLLASRTTARPFASLAATAA